MAHTLLQVTPFLLKNELKIRAVFILKKKFEPSFVEKDGTFITRKNPASSVTAAKELLNISMINIVQYFFSTAMQILNNSGQPYKKLHHRQKKYLSWNISFYPVSSAAKEFRIELVVFQ